MSSSKIHSYSNMAEKFCLKWNDFSSNVSKSFGVLRTADYLHDVTLVSEDRKQVAAHRLVLAACSEYFRDIFRSTSQHAHPLLCLDGITAGDLSNILDYIYNGEIQIYQDNLDRFLAVAQKFRLEGLLGDTDPQSQDLPENYPSSTKQVEHFQDDAFPHEPITKKKAKNENPPSNRSRDLATLDRVTVPIASSEMSEIQNKINEHLERCEDGKFRCTLCGKTATQKIQIEYHIEGLHLEGVSIPCPLCEKTFRSRNAMRWHKSRNHN